MLAETKEVGLEFSRGHVDGSNVHAATNKAGDRRSKPLLEDAVLSEVDDIVAAATDLIAT